MTKEKKEKDRDGMSARTLEEGKRSESISAIEEDEQELHDILKLLNREQKSRVFAKLSTDLTRRTIRAPAPPRGRPPALGHN